ncbi:MAG TPA: hypothetical protein PLU53_02125 [Bacteroidia bacterium]|nr:hypothetical protein [Bacteroidia bacterium]
MKSRIILLAIVLILATPLWMRIAWEFSPKKSLNVLIVDKTVLNKNSFKHRAVNWILDYEKYIKPDSSYYDINKDYFGFFPEDDEKYQIRDFEKLNDNELDSLVDTYDMAYFTDTYGVLGNEWYRHRDVNENSESIYGGMSEKDLFFLRKMKAKGKTILAEFNSIAFPTPVDVRKNFEGLFGIEWTGWMARYIASLDTVNNPDLPKWIVKTYKQTHNGVWNFKKAGLLFIHENGKVLVMEEGRELNEAVPKIYTDLKYRNQYNIPSVMIYPYWMDIMINRNDTNEVMSKYILNTTAQGSELLAQNNIPKIYPAILKRTKDCRFFYFCGDFADNPTKFRFAKLSGITGLKFLMYNAVDITDRNRFFWEFYLPMMQRIFREAYLVSGPGN